MQGFSPCPLLPGAGAAGGRLPLWLQQHAGAGKLQGATSILPHVPLTLGWGSRAAPALSAAMLKEEGSGGARCWRGQHRRGCRAPDSPGLVQCSLLSSLTRAGKRMETPRAPCLSPPARGSRSSPDPVRSPGRLQVGAGAGIPQRCALALLLPAPLPGLAGKPPAFPLRSARTCQGLGPVLWSCSTRCALRMPSAAVSVFGDGRCWCLRYAGGNRALSNPCQVCLVLACILGQVLTCFEVTGPEISSCRCLVGRKKQEKWKYWGKIKGKWLLEAWVGAEML